MSILKKLFGGKSAPLVSKRDDQPDVVHVPDSDQLMNDAIRKAHLTLHYFKSSLVNPQPDQQYFSLKARITDGTKAEHIWLGDVSFDKDENFYGKLANAPLDLKNVRIDQQVGVPLKDVSDWMIVENGRLIGGYTIRALRVPMSDAERQNFDASIGLLIDEGFDYFPHDFTTPEGAILCLEDAYDSKDLDRAIACKDFHEEAKMMLRKNEAMKGLAENREMVDKMEAIIRLSFIKHMAEDFPSFAGVRRAFPDTRYINNDLAIVTEVCFNPDRTKTIQRLYVSKASGEWRVLSLAE